MFLTGGCAMKTVKEVSKLTGISIRTLHHYDAIGLLKPTCVTESGYRLYDDAALGRLQNILLFRALRFPLKEIKRILDTPGFDPVQALEQQIHLLALQREHLGKLIDHARQIQKTGGITMDFSAFDTTEMDSYSAQAKEKWGTTGAYKEFEQKTAGQAREQMRSTGDALMDIFAQFGAIRHLSPASRDAQALVTKLQNFITEHYYTCTKQILRGLGQMYIAGDSMTENIDKAGGAGTAQFAHDAINVYCK
jgi:DNA-binding transcriptional MerR regulator